MNVKKLIDFISKLLLMLMMGFSFVYPITTTLSFDYKPLQVLWIILATLLLLSLLLVNRIMTRITTITAIAGSIIFIVYSIVNGLIFHIANPFISLYNYIQSTENASESFAFGYTLAFSIIFSLIIYIFTVKKFNFYVIFLTGFSIFCSQWILGYFAPNAYVAFYTFVVSILIYYLLHVYNKKAFQTSNDYANISSFILFALPVSLIVLLLTAFIPVRQRPIEWKWLDDKINYAFGHYTGINGKFTGSDYFSLSSVGFGNSSNLLGGDITPDDTMVLRVNAPRPVYLKGRTCDQYTGNSWLNSTISYSELNDTYNRMSTDIFELEYGNPFLLNKFTDFLSGYSSSPNALPYSSKASKDFLNLSIDEIYISYVDLITNSLFTPLKSYNFKFSSIDNSDVFVTADGVLLSRNSLRKDFNYSLLTYNLNYGNLEFEEFLRQSRRYLYSGCLDDSINSIIFSITNNLASTVREHSGAHTETIFSDLYQLEIRDIILNSSTIDETKSNLKEYLINYFSSMLDMSDAEREMLEMSTIPQCFANIEMIKVYENSQDLFERIMTLMQLTEISRETYSKYLSIPQTVPDRVKTLAVSITKNEFSMYDKVKAIEQYLSKNYKYSYTPGNLPEGRDFVDYFLFDVKEGYCTYYATAMCILTRCIGIPSRYVEGYILPPTPIKDNLYEVTNQQAHAWVEVYFEGIGWIQFEPTSSFGGNLYQNNRSPQSNPNPNPARFTPAIRTSGPSNNNLPKEETTNTKTDYTKLLVILAAIVSVILVFSLIVLANILRRKRIISNISKLPPREGILELYNYFMKYLVYQNADFAGGETPMEHAARLDNIGRFFPYKLQEVARIFVDARYSKKELSKKDFQKVLDFYLPVLKATKENLGIVRYTLYMYLLFKL